MASTLMPTGWARRPERSHASPATEARTLWKSGDYTCAVPNTDDCPRAFVRPRAQGQYRICIDDEQGALLIVICTE